MSGIANSPHSDHFKQVFCSVYLKGYKKGLRPVDFNNSRVFDFKADFSYKSSLKLSMEEKASLDVVMSNTFNFGVCIGVKHTEKVNKKNNTPVFRSVGRLCLCVLYMCVLFIFFIVFILCFFYS